MATSDSVLDLARTIHQLKRDIARLNAGRVAPQLAASALEDGAIPEYDAAGTLVGVIGKQPDGSHTHVVLDGPTPLQPSAPTCTGLALEVEVAWDGHLVHPDTGQVDEHLTQKADTDAVEVHLGDSDVFFPSWGAAGGTLRGEIRARTASTAGVPAPAGDWWVRLVVRSQAGKHGPPSVAVPVTVEPLVDQGQFDDLQGDLDAAEASLVDAQGRLDAAFVRLDSEGRSVVLEPDTSDASVWDLFNELAVGTPDGLVKDGPGHGWIISKDQVPFDPDALYRVQATVEVTRDTTGSDHRVYVGVAGRSASGELVNKKGAASYASQHYVAVAGYQQTVADGPVTYTGWVRGHAPAGQDAPGGAAPDRDDPAVVHADVEALSALAILDYNNGDGRWVISDVTITQDTATLSAAARVAANAAQSTANQAVSDAADADAAALAAAGLAESKGEVIYQASPPTGSRANAANLWIRASDNKPHTFDGSSWVAVTDQAALDAASAAAAADSAAQQAIADAAAAQDAADAAQSAADGAQSTADAAMVTASGKNTITYTDVLAADKPGGPPAADSGRAVNDVHRNRNASTGEVYAEWLWSGTAWRVVNFGDAILRSLDVGKLTAGTGVIQQAVIDRMAVQLADIIEANIGNLTVTGDAQMATVVAQAIASQTGEFLQLLADQITGGEIVALVKILSQGELQVGDTSQVHVRIKDGAVRVYLPGREVEAGVWGDPIEIAAFGGTQGNSVAAVDPATGAVLGALRSDGSVTSGHVDASRVTLDGDDLQGLLDRGYQRIVARGEYSTKVGPYNTKTGVYELGFRVKEGHSYRFNARFRGRCPTSYFSAGITAVRRETKALTDAPLVTSSPVGDTLFFDSGSSLFESRIAAWEYVPPGDGYARVLFWVDSANSSHDVDSRGHYFWVVDEGPTVLLSGQPSMGGASGTTAPPVAEVDDFRFFWRFEDHQVWSQFGKNTSFDPHFLRHGQGGSSRYRTYLPFSQLMRDQVAAADDLTKAELYLSGAQGRSDVDLWVGTIRTLDVDGSTEPTIYDGKRMLDSKNNPVTFSPGDKDYVTLHADHLADIKSGLAKGLVIGRTVWSPLIDYYGTGASQSDRPRLRLTGTE
jgi:hypothetical protein